MEKTMVYTIIGGILLIVIINIVGFKIIEQRVTNRVIETLRRDYTPGPYTAGYDPDKIDFKAFRGTSSNWTADWEAKRQ